MAGSDQAWIAWGEQDPYFAVITMPEFRKGVLDEKARARFFEMGERHAGYVLNMCRRHVDPKFQPRTALDFGCGVGRVLLPFAAQLERVVGVDISPAMLAEAQRNAQERRLGNVELLLSDDTLSRIEGRFDLVHSAIVLQHIDVPRGRRLFARLLECIAPGGIGALQLTYAKAYHADRFGQPPPQPAPPPTPEPTDVPRRSWLGRLRRRPERSPTAATAAAPVADPEMQMNPYNLTEIAFMIQSAGIPHFHSIFTDHGGEWGVFLFLQRPAAAG